MAKTRTILRLPPDCLAQAANGGLFVSRGTGIHPCRTIDTWELIYVRQGTLNLRVAKQQFTVHQKQALLLQPGIEHAGTQPYDADLSFYWLHFHVPKHANPRQTNALKLTQHSQPRRPDRLMELMHRFLDEQVNQTLTALSGNCLLMLMLNEVADTLPRNEQTTDHSNSLAMRAERYIMANAHQPISTIDIAGELDCNPDYLGQCFRHTFGMTITQAITRLRLAEAKRLLMDSDLNIDQIARTSGFATPGYFRRTFKAAAGITPRQYRNNHQRLHINWR
ncbi:MAG: AraC family transcriptional regulator [Phycisphaeraceae bacterium]|nr:AraC family transcriptional regulator [Phycisphaeraceae bacterium]